MLVSLSGCSFYSLRLPCSNDVKRCKKLAPGGLECSHDCIFPIIMSRNINPLHLSFCRPYVNKAKYNCALFADRLLGIKGDICSQSQDNAIFGQPAFKTKAVSEEEYNDLELVRIKVRDCVG